MPSDLPEHASTGIVAPTAVSVGILTYHRPESLVETLESLAAGGLFQRLADRGSDDRVEPSWTLCEVLVIDNDRSPSAADAVAAFARGLATPEVVHHLHEPEPGLAAARNRALDEAAGDVLVFIDDDERADAGWPDGLVTLLTTSDAAMVGAPVRTEFSSPPPDWVVSGGYFDRAEPPHGALLPWLRSGNLAIDLAAVREAGVRFDPAFGRSGGEDVAFSRLAVRHGLTLRWASAEAVTETVGPERTTARWVLNRWRKGSSAYARAHLAADDSLRRRLSTAARGVARLGQGAATVLLGGVSLHWGRVMKGVAEIHRGVGYLEGVVGRRSQAYGVKAGRKPYATEPTDKP
ncbi:MAG: glycosyltransferase family 2 protein [Actinomycetota bacterium]